MQCSGPECPCTHVDVGIAGSSGPDPHWGTLAKGMEQLDRLLLGLTVATLGKGMEQLARLFLGL